MPLIVEFLKILPFFVWKAVEIVEEMSVVVVEIMHEAFSLKNLKKI